MSAPVILKDVPAQVVNEQAAYPPFDLKHYVQIEEGQKTRFSAGLDNGEALPTGLICSESGIVTGIPARGTAGVYHFVVTAENADGRVDLTFSFTIKPGLAATEAIESKKAEIWQALQNNQAISPLEVMTLPVTGLDIYYLLERWATLKIWDAFNLDAAGEPKLLNLKGASEHYAVYDRGSCLVAVPKDLFSSERTLRDGLVTARAMAAEVYQRGWAVELVGFDKLVRATWMEIQYLGEKHGKALEVVNFDPTSKDVELYNKRASEPGLGNL